ncbi:MAG: hypothetical protein BGO67_05085 [Alphaproteobacteria bacterium 41-28]|mgnify:CR=1 FL=1|nr:MAG: hypothetical protein BGO67_05085 [Alphaproteobacteria bacterium 41-28]
MNFNLLKNYPPQFGGLCFTQAFYNFSFYGLKSIFVLYIITQLSLPESKAISLFATWMALAYGSSLIGGWVADNIFNAKTTIILGGLFQSLGIFFLTYSQENLVFLALALITLGSGFFKPTLSTSVGMLFDDPQDPKRDKAYSTFYVAMNLGSFIGPLICGFISKTYGGYYTSLLLIIMTLIGGIYLFYKRISFNHEKNPAILKKTLAFHAVFVGVGIVVLIFFLALLYKYHDSFHHFLAVIALGSFIYFGKIFYQSDSRERKDILNILLYILLFAFFCSLFEQAGSSLILFFDKSVDRTLLGMEIPSSALLSLNPIFVLICGPLFILFSERVIEKHKRIDGFVKMGAGFLLTGLSFFVLALSCSQRNTLVSLAWVVIALLVQVIGELFIVPIGYSNISKLSPPRYRSLMMSYWLMAIAYGNYFAGFIAQFSLSNPEMSESPIEHYQAFFLSLTLMPCLIGFLLLLYFYVKQSKSVVKRREAFRMQEEKV